MGIVHGQKGNSMKKKWTDNLPNDVYDRLCHCRTIRSDLPALVNAKWLSFVENGKADQGFTKEDALVDILDLLDCNSQYLDLTREEYESLCR